MQLISNPVRASDTASIILEVGAEAGTVPEPLTWLQPVETRLVLGAMFRRCFSTSQRRDNSGTLLWQIDASTFSCVVLRTAHVMAYRIALQGVVGDRDLGSRHDERDASPFSSSPPPPTIIWAWRE
jgi:hypothetical protein